MYLFQKCSVFGESPIYIQYIYWVRVMPVFDNPLVTIVLFSILTKLLPSIEGSTIPLLTFVTISIISWGDVKLVFISKWNDVSP